MSPCCDHAEGRSAALQATVGRPPGNPDLTDDEAYRAGERDQQTGDSGDNQHWDYHPADTHSHVHNGLLQSARVGGERPG